MYTNFTFNAKSFLQHAVSNTVKSRFRVLALFAILLFGMNASAHTFEIRVNQNLNGSLTWYLQSYHQASECPKADAGININGVNYPISGIYSGDARSLSPNIFSQYAPFAKPGYYVSYAVVETPHIPGNLNVNPYSSANCFAFIVGGSANFTPPAPNPPAAPALTTPPVPDVANLVTATGECTVTLKAPTATDANKQPVTGTTPSPLTYTAQGTFYVTWTYKDASGNSSTQPQTVVVHDDIAPVLAAPVAMTVANGSSILPAFTGNPVVSDNCTATSDIIVSYADDTSPGAYGGLITRTWTAADAALNISTSVQLITIGPAALPVLDMQAATTISVTCGDVPMPGTISFTNGLGTGALISGTSNASTFTAIPGTCGGLVTETWTASDGIGRPLASVSRTVTISQNLGSIESFVFFSGAGAVSNTGNSNVTGDIGSDVGAISGFGTSAPGYGSYSSTSVTIQAKKDLLNLYIHLSNIPVTSTLHTPTFGGSETLVTGVYTVGGAGSLMGKLILDGQGDPNAVFIFKFNGAFSAAASSAVMLTGGVRACNVFWVAEGAISIGTSVTMKGTLLSHTGAVAMAAGGNLEGRMLSTVGAVSFGPGVANLPMGVSTLPVICVNPGNMVILGSTSAFTLFSSAGAVSNIGSSGFIGDIGTQAGALTGFGTASTTLVGATQVANAVTAQAKTDLQSAYTKLRSMAATTAHAPTFGSGEVLIPGVYNMGAAGSLAGTLTLDGQGDPNSVFVFKFGGAFSTAAQSKVILINGAAHSNVYWVAEGAISMGALSFMKGALIAHNGANSMGAGGNLEGRMFSTAGAVSFNAGVGYISYSLCENPQNMSASSIAFNPVSSFIQSLTEKELIIFPNPSRGTINLNYLGDAANVRSVEIFTTTGRLVYASGSYKSTISLRRLTAGIYFVNVHLNTKTITRKIIVD